MVSIPETVALVGGVISVIYTILNIRKQLADRHKGEVDDAVEASVASDQKLTMFMGSAQVATGFLQDVLKRADQEIERRDQRIEELESDLRRCREGRPKRAD